MFLGLCGLDSPVIWKVPPDFLGPVGWIVPPRFLGICGLGSLSSFFFDL